MLLVVFFVLGAASALVQSVFIREFLNVFYGNELALGMILGIWLFWVAAGAYVGARAASKIKRLQSVFVTLILASVLFAFLQVFFIRIARDILSVPAGQYIPFAKMAVFTLAVTAPFCFITGFIFPVGARIHSGPEGAGASKISALYIAESAGFLAGGLIFVFGFALHYSAYIILASVYASVALAANAFILKNTKPRVGFRTIVFAVACALMAVYFFTSAGPLEKTTVLRRWQSLNSGTELVSSVDSKYQNLALGRQAGQLSLFGNGNFVFSFPDNYENAPVANIALFEHKDPKSVLVIGEIAPDILGSMLRHPVNSVDCVMLDRAAAGMLGIPADPRLKLVFADARYFAKNCKKRYDVIFSGFPAPSTAMLNRYYTEEFFREAGKLLNPGGVFACFGARTADAITWQTGNYFSSTYKTLSGVFPYVKVSQGYTNYFFCSADTGVVTDDCLVLQERYRERKVTTPFFSEEYFRYFFPPERTVYINDFLNNWPWARNNTDLKPVSYFYSLLLWDAYSGSRLGPFLRRVPGWFRIWWIAAGIGLLVVLRLIFTLAAKQNADKQRKFNSLFAVFSCGFAAMGFEMIFIFMFQGLYGHLYQMVGLITAVFMSGLASGGWAMMRFSAKEGREKTGFIMISSATALLAILLPLLIKISPNAFVFMVPVFLAGFITGSGFPLAASLYGRAGNDAGGTAGAVSWADNTGGFLGAALCGTLLVPLLGIQSTCFLIMLLSVSSAVFFIFSTEK